MGRRLQLATTSLVIFGFASLLATTATTAFASDYAKSMTATSNSAPPTLSQPSPWFKESAGLGPCKDSPERLLEERSIPTVSNLRPAGYRTKRGVVLTNYGGVGPRTDGLQEAFVADYDLRGDLGSGFYLRYLSGNAYQRVRVMSRCVNGAFEYWYRGGNRIDVCRIVIYTYAVGLPIRTDQRFVPGTCPKGPITP